MEDYAYKIIPFTVKQDDTKCYTALSYTWGKALPKELQKTIIVNGHRLCVRDNLFGFLEAQRESARLDYLWIDAICINQNDLAEKSHQVALMSKIFKSAKKVYVWLGKGHTEIDAACKTLSMNSYRPRLRMTSWGLVRNTETNIHHHTPEDQLVLEKGMRAILQLPYWSRIWVVQEILLAQKVALLYGQHDVEWSAFKSEYDRLEVDHRGRDDLASPEPLFRTNYGYGERSLRDLVWRFCQRECENPLDHVYALIGMATDWFVGHKLLVVDYAISTDRLLARVIDLLDTYDWAIIRHLIRCLSPEVDDCNPWKDFPLAKKKARSVQRRKSEERMQRARTPDVYDTESESSEEASVTIP